MSTKPPWQDDSVVEVIPDDHPWATMFPAVWGFLTDRKGDLGKKVENATLTVLIEHGVTKACLNDRHRGRSLWRSGPVLEAALGAMNEAIMDGHPDWRYYGQAKKR